MPVGRDQNVSPAVGNTERSSFLRNRFPGEGASWGQSEILAEVNLMVQDTAQCGLSHMRMGAPVYRGNSLLRSRGP